VKRIGVLQEAAMIHDEGGRFDDPGEKARGRRFAIVKHEDVKDEEFSKRRLGHLRRKLGVIPVVVNSFSEVPEVLGSLYKDALERDLPRL
jgi:hypothetical protein